MSATIKDSGDANIRKLISNLQGSSITVGVHERQGALPKMEKRASGRGKKRKQAEFSNETIAEVATKHELGIGVPQRSFICAWVDENQQKLEQRLRTTVQRAMKKGEPAAQGLDRYGLWAVGQIKRRIIAHIPPSLSERRKREKAAVGCKAKDTPLIFTGQLLSAIMTEKER